MQVAATGITMAIAALAVVRPWHAAGVCGLGVLGLFVGLSMVPQQHRLFMSVARLAPVAMGLNGSAIYVATGLGGAIGGIAVARGGASSLVLCAAALGLLAIIVTIWVPPKT
jgi:predicted MFS family arabinose efflux permease